MPLIRNKQAAHITSRAVALELNDVRSEAREVIESARSEATRILAQVRDTVQEERTTILESARAEGRQAGYEEGLATGRQEGMEQVLSESLEPHRALLDEIAPNWAEQLKRFSEEREQLMEESRREILTFGIELARRIIHRTIQQDEGVCVEQVTEAIRLIGRQTQMRISVSPEDLHVLERALPGVLQAARLADDVELIEDPAISRGGCVLSTPEGSIDATIETQLDRIVDILIPRAEP